MDQGPEEPSGRPRRPRPPAPRGTVEFLALLAIGILLSRTFFAEAYVVPTGSMATTLLGIHRSYRCPSCGFRFPIGADEDGRSPRPICPNCGADDLGDAEVVDGGGDRLLVHKFAFDLRPPRRWEAAVFQSPMEPDQAYVKRVVGLPGESVQIRDGDVWIDGRIARKSAAERKALAILVYDHDFQPSDHAEHPRWSARIGDGRVLRESAWKPAPGGFVHRPIAGENRVDWLEYRHWRPELGAFGPVHDFNAYNGGDLPAENVVGDLCLGADVAIPDGSAAAIHARIGSEGEVWTIRFPGLISGEVEPPEVRLNGEVIPLRGGPGERQIRKILGKGVWRVEVDWVDRRLAASIDGIPIFAPIDLESRAGRGPAIAPAIGVGGEGAAGLRGLKVFRDVYYTDSLAYIPKKPFGVDEPYLLKAGEYFVLGDNSPVSKDSRFWANSPVVEADRFLGRPFLVHLPSRAVPLRAFGRDLYWIPDPREIRYIR